jgi:hypothetical protein
MFSRSRQVCNVASQAVRRTVNPVMRPVSQTGVQVNKMSTINAARDDTVKETAEFYRGVVFQGV